MEKFISAPGFSESAVAQRTCSSCGGEIPEERGLRCREQCDSVTYCSRRCQEADWFRHKAACHQSVTQDDNEIVVSAEKVCASCGKASESLKKCTRCWDVAYCGRDCQQADWPTHKVNCRVTTTKEEPLDQEAREMCASCGKASESLRRCTSCKKVSYCGRDCQKADWSIHKVSCQKKTTTEEKSREQKTKEVCASCGKESESLKKCTICRNVAYCGRDCQQADWPKHKVSCKVTTTEEPIDQQAREMCALCGKSSENVRKCAKCKKVSYCDKTCQRADWPTHKTVCGRPA